MRPVPDIDLAALERAIERNRRERLEYIRFKVKWMRENGQIKDP